MADTMEFLDGNEQIMMSLSETAKTCCHLSEEGATCGPFTIIVGEKLNRDKWGIDYLHADQEDVGRMVFSHHFAGHFSIWPG